MRILDNEVNERHAEHRDRSHCCPCGADAGVSNALPI
jgi:hypothetical protein